MRAQLDYLLIRPEKTWGNLRVCPYCPRLCHTCGRGSYTPCWATSSCPPKRKLLVRNGRARRTGQIDKFEMLEPRFAAPFAELCAGVVKGIAELNEHVQRH